MESNVCEINWYNEGWNEFAGEIAAFVPNKRFSSAMAYALGKKEFMRVGFESDYAQGVRDAVDEFERTGVIVPKGLS